MRDWIKGLRPFCQSLIWLTQFCKSIIVHLKFFHLAAKKSIDFPSSFFFLLINLVSINWPMMFLKIYSVQFSCSVMSDSLWPHELQHARPPCPSQTPGVYSNLCPSSRWCHPAISSSVVLFSSIVNLPCCFIFRCTTKWIIIHVNKSTLFLKILFLCSSLQSTE